MKKLKTHTLIGGTLVAALLVLAVVAAVWTPYNPLAIDLRSKLQSPSLAHWLGTDEFGRDVASRAMRGASTSCLVALLTVTLATSVGLLVGVVAGFLRGWTDRVLMALNDTLLAFPGH